MEDKKAIKSNSKKSLRTMQKNRSKNFVRKKARVIKYGTKGFGRNIWLSSAATVVMAVTLIILFITVVASIVLTQTAEIMKEKIDITVYIKPETSKEILNGLADVLKEDNNVREIEVSDSKEEYEKFLEENKGSDEILEVMDDDMKALMISKMQATMRVRVYDVNNLSSIKELIANNQQFVKYIDSEKLPTYDVNQAEINTITSWANIAKMGGIILAIIFLVISVLIIFSTIRMAIFSRREEIYMMKLVGADKSFIRGPFLVEAEICGLIAGILASAASYFSFEFLAPKLNSYGIDVSTVLEFLESNRLILLFITFIIIGIIIGRVSARLAISRYLHRA